MQHTVSIPTTLSEDLAEFIGILLGDGCIAKSSNQIYVSCGLIDKEYIYEFIPNLIWNLFSKKSSIKITRGWGIGIHCYFTSKTVSNYLAYQLNFPKGKKIKSNPEIPKIFYESTILLRACVRGLFDTDGGVHRHHKKSVQLKFTNKSFSLNDSLKNALVHLGFMPTIVFNKKRKMYNIYLFTEDVKKYFEEIGSNNPKNNIKFNKWVETGIMPLNSEIKQNL